MLQKNKIYKIQLKRTSKTINQIKAMENQNLKDSKLAWGEPLYMGKPNYLVIGKEPTGADDMTKITTNKVVKFVDRVTTDIPTGTNQWDEKWEIGTLDASGVPTPSPSSIRSTNFCTSIFIFITIHSSHTNHLLIISIT